MKTDVNRFFFFQNIKKKVISVLPTLTFFLYFLEKEKSINLRFDVLNHFPKFQRRIFIIEDEKWVKHNCSYDNYHNFNIIFNLIIYISILVCK